ncbi:unnamed protein product [Phyllotreta striolata]|uniref:RCC1 domain-containing protein 1 n=1 Tax=Phyllotreta striolata TaxID=444603 RepID=A0A9N9XM37_PHYSR|nr:unnamed protein product [Phyllotreta striolata]
MKLYCNGFNLFRQLNINTPVLQGFSKAFEFEVIKQVCINHSYTVIITNTDCLVFYKEGICNINSVVEKKLVLLASNDDELIFTDDSGILYSSCLSNFSNIKTLFSSELGNSIINIASGSKLIVAYFSDGSIYKLPQKLSFRSNDVVDIKCGKEHCLLLDKTGNVYSFGKGSRGQLGHGKLEEEPEPRLIECLAGIRIEKISAGGWHSCALSHEGDLYVWGWNSNGQLGLGKEEIDKHFVAVMASPAVVDFLEESWNATMVACGSRHTIILFDNNQLYGCGWNKYHQLNETDRENYHTLTHLHDFEDETVLGLHCGPWNSAVRCK